ncbi:MAG: diguanylate cyclase [Pelosinus sp.]|jgi:diguanylate cyclase (GGDEF)-like protein|nr:diguanylate cyclase [Pelosinus sp.]
MIPQGIMLWMASSSPLEGNKYFSEIEALSLASALILILVIPGLTVNWLVGKDLNNMRQLCSRVKQGNYKELLSLPNEARNGEDDILVLMRDMNWMARQIEFRESAWRQAVEDLQASRSRMQVMAMTDPLTSIANRRCFFDTLDQHFKALACHYQPISLIIFDVDFFKKINDTYGHQAGDKTLLELAKIIQENSREGDLAARIGGEEYALLLPNTDSQGAVGIASRIHKKIAEHIFVLDERQQISVTASIGVCTLSQFLCCIDKEKIYNYADQALYYSKHIGRNSVSIYDPDTHIIHKVA